MIKQVIVMRKDLKMRRGKQIAQGAHASMKALLDRGNVFYHGGGFLGGKKKYGFEIAYPHLTDEMIEWIEGAFTKICVSVDSEEELLEVYNQAKTATLPCALITDSGKTEFNGVPTNTCCAIGPAKAEEIDKITGDLKLL